MLATSVAARRISIGPILGGNPLPDTLSPYSGLRRRTLLPTIGKVHPDVAEVRLLAFAWIVTQGDERLCFCRRRSRTYSRTCS